jgi:hypothetical protein
VEICFDDFTGRRKLPSAILCAVTKNIYSTSIKASTMNNSMNRRNFLKQTGAAGVSLGMAGYLGSLGNANAQSDSPARAIGANDKITTAVIGTNGRGIAHIDCLARIPGVEISYICDVDDRAIAKGLKEVSKKQKTEAKGLKDFRKALEDKSLDAVTIATPDHWHTPMAILAMQAGKHVDLEKP